MLTLSYRALAMLSLVCLVVPVMPVGHAQDADSPVIHVAVDVTDPASGLITVEITIPPALVTGLADLDLVFWDARDHPGAISAITASSAGQPLAVEQHPANTYQYRVVLENVQADVVCTYTLDPTYFPPGSPPDTPLNAVARLTGNLGVLRLTGIIPMMAFTTDQFALALQFALPDGWIVVQPWSDSNSFSLTPTYLDHSEYLAVGPFEVETISADALSVEFASLPGDDSFPAQMVSDILTYTVDLLDSTPQTGRMSIAVLPETFRYGGSAGQRTIVMNADPQFAAHEMFHWWNDEQRTAADAAWFREGFTDYYSAKIMFGLGLWPVEQAATFLAQMQAGIATLEQDPPRSLVALSVAQADDPAASGLIYLKGHLFAWYLDTLLQQDGRSLDEAMRVILNGEAQALTSADLQQIFHDVYGGLVDPVLEQVVNEGAALPDLLAYDDPPAD